MALTINHQTNDISATSGTMTIDGSAVGGGGGADLYAAETTGATDPTASGTEAIAIGSDAKATGANAIAIGKDTYSTGASSIAIGAASTGYGATGTDSIQIGELAAASATRSVAIGPRATSNSSNGLAVGYNCTAGNSSISVGQGSNASEQQSMAFGKDCTTSYRFSIAIGESVITRNQGSIALRTAYNQQTNKFFLSRQTSDATAVVLQSTSTFVFSASADNQINIPDRCLYAFKGIVAARGNPYQSNTNCAAWEVKGMLRREVGASTTTLINSTISALTSNSPSWSFTLSANTTLGVMAVTVTGQASTTINWTAVIDAHEVKF